MGPPGNYLSSEDEEIVRCIRIQEAVTPSHWRIAPAWQPYLVVPLRDDLGIRNKDSTCPLDGAKSRPSLRSWIGKTVPKSIFRDGGLDASSPVECVPSVFWPYKG